MRSLAISLVHASLRQLAFMLQGLLTDSELPFAVRTMTAAEMFINAASQDDIM